MVRQKSEGPREPKLLRVGVAAYELGLHPFTVRRWIKLGKIQAVRIGLEARIPRSEIERLRGATDERLLVLYPILALASQPHASIFRGCSRWSVKTEWEKLP